MFDLEKLKRDSIDGIDSISDYQVHLMDDVLDYDITESYLLAIKNVSLGITKIILMY